MKAIDYINEQKEIICWNIFRWNEEKCGWEMIDVAQIEEYELIDDAFIDSKSFCDLYLIN